MDRFLESIKERARLKPKRIIFPEGNEARVLEAIEKIATEKVAIPMPLKLAPEKHPEFERAAEQYSKLRDITMDEAYNVVKNPHAFCTVLVEMGFADAMIGGPTAPSRERILTALQILRSDKTQKVSGFFFMILPSTVDPDAANGGVLLFADCAVNIDPRAEDLAQIAMDSADSAKLFGIDPKIAMLSFSTAGSTQHPLAEKVKTAAHLVKIMRPDLALEDMEMQVDTALIDRVAQLKAPGSEVAGHANVLIFPDLEAGNIGYKLVERLAGAKAIGPILQGLKKPINEVSRGSTADDIVNLAAITSVMADAE